jgi:hypothetical protein
VYVPFFVLRQYTMAFEVFTRVKIYIVAGLKHIVFRHTFASVFEEPAIAIFPVRRWCPNLWVTKFVTVAPNIG